MIRRRLVLPGAGRAEEGHELARRDEEAHVVHGDEVAEPLGDAADLDAHAASPARGAPSASGAALSPATRPRLARHSTSALGDERDEGEEREERGHREGGLELVLVVEDLDVEGQGVRLAADVPRDDRHRAELAHRPRVAEDDAVEEAPLHARQRDAEERLPAARAEDARRLLLLGARRLHDRDELARHEREGHEDGGEDEAGDGEDDLEVVGLEPRAERAVPAEEEDEDHPGDDGRDREGEVDERDEDALAREVELRDAPRGREAEDEVERDGDRRGEERELQRRQGHRLAHGVDVGRQPLRERLGEDGGERDDAGRGRGSARARAVRPRRTARGSVSARGAALRRWTRVAMPAMLYSAVSRVLQAWSRLIPSRSTNEATSMTDGDRGRAGVVVLLELGDDEERRDLGLHRHVARDEDDRAVLAERAGEGEGEAGDPRGQRGPEGSTRRRSAARLAPRLAAASSTSGSRLSSTGWSVRTTKGSPMNVRATATPSGVKATLTPQRGEGLPEPARLGVERGEGDAGDGGRQGERQVDERVDEPLAGEAVAHEHPRHHEAEHRVDERGGERRAERQPVGGEDARRGDRGPERRPRRGPRCGRRASTAG